MSDTLRLAVFDVDGTLVDSLASIERAMCRAADSCGCAAPDPVLVRRAIGLPLREAVAAVFPDVGAGRWDELAAGYKEAFWASNAAGETDEGLFPGIVETIDALDRDGIVLGIATSKGRHGLDVVLGRHALDGRFLTLQTADRGPGKPHPDMLLRAMAEVGARPHETVMIGDTSYDMAMARAARTGALGVGWGYHDRAALEGAGADRIVDRAGEIPAAVAAILATAIRA